MEDQNKPLSFNSRSKKPYDKFSNFYETKLEMPEGIFGSVEHYFQAMKFVDENHSRFEINGNLGKQESGSSYWKDTVTRGCFIKSAGGKSGTQKYKLKLRRDGLDRNRAKEKMKEGLRKKFETEPFKSLLLETCDRPLIHTPMRGKTDFWTGRVDKNSGRVTGENNMGKLLMKVREELQKAEKIEGNLRTANYKDDVEIVDEKKGFEEDEVVDEKKSVEEDEVVDEKKGVEEDEVVDEKKGVDEDEIGGEDKSDDGTHKTKEDTSGYRKRERKRGDDDVQGRKKEKKPEGPDVKRKRK